MTAPAGAYARRILVHYLRTIGERAGLEWDTDYTAEIEGALDDLVAECVDAEAAAAGAGASALAVEVRGALDEQTRHRRQLEARVAELEAVVSTNEARLDALALVVENLAAAVANLEAPPL